jgi:hypothetical protein
MVMEEEGGGRFPVFLLTGRRPPDQGSV